MSMKPLVLDVDGTFLRTDLLFEAFWAGLGRDPFATLRASFSHFTDPAALKAALAEIAPLRLDLMPVSEPVRALAERALGEGREVVLASASHISQVKPLAEQYGLADSVLATQGRNNLKGRNKAEALIELYGEGGFDYAGNAPVDKAIWKHADVAYVVGDPKSAQEMQAEGKEVRELPGGWAVKDLIKSFRPHQWVKNVLLLLPLIAAHDFSAGTILFAILGIVSFSAAASSIYLINDLLDLEADRLHVKKCKRPFAAGTVPIQVGMAAFVGLAVLALGLGALLSPAFLGVVAFYMALSLAYSLKLKRMRWVDIAVLASLYTLRVVAGAAATGIYVSGYLLVFIFPVFLALGCVKRLTELTLATDDARLPGRGYGRPDRSDLLNVAGLGVVAALIAFFLYSFTDQANGLYKTQWLIWVAELPMAWWMIRMVRLGWDGKMDYDPIVFAMKDKRGIGLMLISISTMFYAAGLWHKWMGLG